MQLAERRNDPQRIEVARPLEFVQPDGGAVEGYTRNLSATGLRARFDGHCSVGANLLVRIALEEGAPPVEKRARVVWSAPDVYGDGMDVGLRLVKSAEADASPTESEPEPERGPLLTEGTKVDVEYGGIALPAVVSRVGEVTDSGVIQVTLKLLDECLPVSPEEDDSIVVEKAPVVVAALRYTAGVRRFWRLHGAPITRRAAVGLVAVAGAAASSGGRAAVRLGRALWARLPTRLTGPVERVSIRACGLARAAAGRIGAIVFHRLKVSRQEP
jgi:hypothetical protein